MTYGGVPYAGGPYAGALMDEGDIPVDDRTHLSVEVAFTTGALETPVWVDITADVRFWDVQRGRSRELERFQPGRATIVLGNLSRQYDAVYEDGPHFGDLRPMRRVRIRETFNGVTYPVFDGFVDRWQLDYPSVGKDATATLTATDGFKVLARTDLPRSVYTAEVEADAPVLWWRLDEPDSDPSTVALNWGSLGDAADGTYVGPVRKRGEQGLVFKDPGTAISVQDPGGLVAVPDMGVWIADGDFDISDTGSWAIEFWVRPAGEPIGTDKWVQGENSSGNARLVIQSSGTQAWQFRLVESGDAVEYGVTGNAADQVANTTYHIVAKFGPSKAMAIYVNGTKYTTTATGTTAPPLVGTIHPNMDLGFLYTFGDNQTPEAIASEFAVYTSAEGVDPLPDERVTAHYEAGTAPWQGDLGGARAHRILDLAEWSSELRELDAGVFTFQSAATNGQTVLEHLHKIAESDLVGAVFMTRDGTVRYLDQISILDERAPGPTVYGDGAGEVGYRSIRPDDGDEVIRNSATISRLNGVAKRAEDASSIDEFGRFDYTLEGLLHASDLQSESIAEFVVGEYAEPRRRIVELTIGPPPDGEEDVYYPAMLGPELGEAIIVRSRPSGIGGYEQTCVIEGISHQSAPGRNRTTTFILSPEIGEDGVAVTLAGALLAENGDTLITESGDTLTLEG